MTTNKGKQEQCESQGRGVIFQTLLLLIVVAVVALTSLAYTFGYIVEPGYVGVRQITFGVSKGYSRDGLPPGYHWSIPGYSKFYFVPQTIQALNLDRRHDIYPETIGPLEVQTKDGSSVVVDITVFYRFWPKPGVDSETGIEHGGPADLIRDLGVQANWISNIQTGAINELKKTLGDLSTSEFYDPIKREKRVREAEAKLNIRFAPYGIHVESVLLRRYTYAEERIDRAIYEKNLQDQEERYNQAASRLADAKAKLAVVEAEMDAKIRTLKVDGENQAKVLVSRAELYETEQKAKGDLEVAQAKANVDKMRANVLASTSGAQAYLAREMTPILESLKGGVVSNIDPYDLNNWMRKLGVNGEGKK